MSREIDARIAQEVMGWPIRNGSETPSSYPYIFQEGDYVFLQQQDGNYAAFAPTRHGSNMYMIIQRLRELGCSTHITFDDAFASVRIYTIDDDPELLADIYDHDLMAICRAALDAVEALAKLNKSHYQDALDDGR